MGVKLHTTRAGEPSAAMRRNVTTLSSLSCMSTHWKPAGVKSTLVQRRDFAVGAVEIPHPVLHAGVVGGLR